MWSLPRRSIPKAAFVLAIVSDQKGKSCASIWSRTSSADRLTYLKLCGIFCWRQNQGAITGEHQGKRRFLRFASIDGISDIIGLLPTSGRLLAVEVKRPGRKPTPAQEAFLDVVRQNGGLAACVHSLAELEAVLDQVESVGKARLA